MSEYLPNDEIKFDRNVEIEDILNTPDYSNIEYFIKVDMKYSGNMEYKKNFHLLLKMKKES